MMQAPVLQQMVDRSSPQGGATSLQNPYAIQIAYNAEIRPVPCCIQFGLCFTCRCYNHSRSYLYLRENSIETNQGAEHICGDLVQCLVDCVCCIPQACYECVNCCSCNCLPGCSAANTCRSIFPCFRFADDNVKVVYFDRNYFRPTSDGCCCIQHNTPKLEVVDYGCMICCVRFPRLSSVMCPCFFTPTKDVVIMPYESTKCCCCCDCPNRVTWYHNCCGLLGKVTGSPLAYETFYPQPVNVESFVAYAQVVVVSRQFGQKRNAVHAASQPQQTFTHHQVQPTSPQFGTTTSSSAPAGDQDSVSLSSESMPVDDLTLPSTVVDSETEHMPHDTFKVTRKELKLIQELRNSGASSGSFKSKVPREGGITDGEMEMILRRREHQQQR